MREKAIQSAGEVQVECEKEMRIVRVFPRKTSASPDDDLAYFGEPHLWTDADAVHVSVTWTYDMPRAERLAKEWEQVAPVKIGGPATGMRGENFTPGMYLKHGYTITSRGCPNRCWFCSVWKRDGNIRELPIKDGWNILDDNLLACSETHIREVFDMLRKQPRKPEFTGGLEAKLLKPWIAEELKRLKPAQMFFAYDTPDDLDPLFCAGNTLANAGFRKGSHALRCYVLCGYPKDSMNAADNRMRQAAQAGFLPMAMLWRDKGGNRDPQWMRFAKAWARPASANAMLRDKTTSNEAKTR